jgi:hypothetical protein
MIDGYEDKKKEDKTLVRQEEIIGIGQEVEF